MILKVRNFFRKTFLPNLPRSFALCSLVKVVLHKKCQSQFFNWNLRRHCFYPSKDCTISALYHDELHSSSLLCNFLLFSTGYRLGLRSFHSLRTFLCYTIECQNFPLFLSSLYTPLNFKTRSSNRHVPSKNVP